MKKNQMLIAEERTIQQRSRNTGLEVEKLVSLILSTFSG